MRKILIPFALLAGALGAMSLVKGNVPVGVICLVIMVVLGITS